MKTSNDHALAESTTRVPEQLAFVVVVFDPEWDLLMLQAKSLGRFADPDLVSRYLVLDQSDRPMPPRRRRKLAKALGPLEDRLEIQTIASSADGWVQQQVLKLTVAQQIVQDAYVVLDAKTHAVSPITRSTFFATDGRAHLRRYSYLGHPMQSRVETTLAWLGQDVSLIETDLPGTTTPFVFWTQEVRQLIESVQSRTKSPFASAFASAGLIEFPLYSLWLQQQGRLERKYDREPISCTTVWSTQVGLADLRALLPANQTPPAFAAVHRSGVARLKLPAMAYLAQRWRQFGLFDHTISAMVLLFRSRTRIWRWKLRSLIARNGS